MAITLADFDKIWASTSPLTPYSFSESNYKQGWNFIGSTPPARQMWDYLQKYNDEKMQYLANNYLPLSGGTLTGAITQTQGTALKRNVDNSSITIFGGTDQTSAYVNLNGKNHATGAGEFTFRASDGTYSSFLVGKPDGTLTWGGHNVVTTNNLSGTESLSGVPDLSVFADYKNFTAPTARTNYSVYEGGYKKVGNIVYVHVKIKSAASQSKGSWGCVEGLPNVKGLVDDPYNYYPLDCWLFYGDSYAGILSGASISGGGTVYIQCSDTLPVTPTDRDDRCIIIHGFYYTE